MHFAEDGVASTRSLDLNQNGEWPIVSQFNVHHLTENALLDAQSPHIAELRRHGLHHGLRHRTRRGMRPRGLAALPNVGIEGELRNQKNRSARFLSGHPLAWVVAPISISKKAQLGDLAGATGAALLARRALKA